MQKCCISILHAADYFACSYKPPPSQWRYRSYFGILQQVLTSKCSSGGVMPSILLEISSSAADSRNVLPTACKARRVIRCRGRVAASNCTVRTSDGSGRAGDFFLSGHYGVACGGWVKPRPFLATGPGNDTNPPPMMRYTSWPCRFSTGGWSTNAT